MQRSFRAIASGMAVASVTLLLVGGCTRQDAGAAAPALSAPLPAGLQPVASVLDIMRDTVDPLADELWEAVSIVSTLQGEVEQMPDTDEQWQELDRKALALMEAANLLVVEGRPVAHPGQELEETDPETDLSPAAAQAAIDKDRGTFVAFSVALQAAGGSLRQAIASRDAEQYLNAGSLLYDACEGCHRNFWYPDTLTPEDFL